MSIKPSEISELIKQRIERFQSAAEARNVGTVVCERLGNTAADSRGTARDQSNLSSKKIVAKHVHVSQLSRKTAGSLV